MHLHSFKKLLVWQKAIQLNVSIYQEIMSSPIKEEYFIKDQILKSALSISSNIAEGCGSGTKNNFIRYLTIAQGSAYELESQLIIAKKLFKIDLSELLKQLNEIQKMIYVLNKRIQC